MRHERRDACPLAGTIWDMRRERVRTRNNETRTVVAATGSSTRSLFTGRGQWKRASQRSHRRFGSSSGCREGEAITAQEGGRVLPTLGGVGGGGGGPAP